MKKIAVNLLDSLESGIGDYERFITGGVDLPSRKFLVPVQVDVRAIRERQQLSQEEFAYKYNISVSTIRNWEQGKRSPEQSSAMLLKLIDKFPEQIADEVDALRRAVC